jgi:hypothetical protein
MKGLPKKMPPKHVMDKIRNPGLRFETGDFDLPNQSNNPLFDTVPENQRVPNRNQRPTQTDTEPQEPEKPIGGPIRTKELEEINEEQNMPNNNTAGGFDNSGYRSRNSRSKNSRGRSTSRSSGTTGRDQRNTRQQSNSNSVNETPFGNSSPTNPVHFSTQKSGVWWSNPIDPQVISDDENTSRSAFTIIRCNHSRDASGLTTLTKFKIADPSILVFDGQSRMEGAYKRYFSDIKQEITANTNATPAVQKVIYYDNFKTYQQLGISLVAALAELSARMQWSPDFEESNLVHRNIRNLTSSSTNLYKARNRAYDALALMAVPTEIISYYQWLFQTYKRSEVTGGVTHTFISPELAYDLNYDQNITGCDFTVTIEKLDWLCAQINKFNLQQANFSNNVENTSLGSFTQMTSLLMHKTDFPFINPRESITSTGVPIFSKEMNAIINNFVVKVSNTTNTDSGIKLYPKPGVDAPTVGLPFEASEVPCSVGAHLLSGFGVNYESTAGFPWFKTGCPAYISAHDAMFIAETSSLAPGFDFLFDFRRGSDYQITDHIFKYRAGTIGDTGTTPTGILIPRGDNVRCFQLGTDNATLDCVKMFYEQLGVRSGY